MTGLYENGECDATRELVAMRWGLVPSWWKKKAKETPSTFNARAELVAHYNVRRQNFQIYSVSSAT